MRYPPQDSDRAVAEVNRMHGWHAATGAGQGRLSARGQISVRPRWAPLDVTALAALVLGAVLAGCAGPAASRVEDSGLAANEHAIDEGEVDDAALEVVGRRRRILRMTAERSANCRAYEPLFAAAAARYGVDAQLLMATAWVESGFSADARSSAGAVGVMQLMPRTGAAMGCHDREDPACSIDAGAKLLGRLIQRFDGNVVHALCAYNAGGVAVRRALREGRIPSNHSYAERVMDARARLRRTGCRPSR